MMTRTSSPIGFRQHFATLVGLDAMTGWGRAEAAYNLRQLKLAKSALDHYCIVASERRVRDLGDLVWRLDRIKAVLESPDEEWLDELEDPLLTLESTYAVNLDRAARALDCESARRVEEAVRTLRTTVASATSALEPLAEAAESR
jgi:hypothetical protein